MKKNLAISTGLPHSWKPGQSYCSVWLPDLWSSQASANIEMTHAVSQHVLHALDPLYVSYSIGTANIVGPNLFALGFAPCADNYVVSMHTYLVFLNRNTGNLQSQPIN